MRCAWASWVLLGLFSASRRRSERRMKPGLPPLQSECPGCPSGDGPTLCVVGVDPLDVAQRAMANFFFIGATGRSQPCPRLGG